MGADALSDVLRTVRLTGAVYFNLDLTSPWAAEAPAARLVAPIVMPEAEHVIEFHVIAKGACWGGLVGEAPRRLEAGDVVVFPQGDPHQLSSAPGMRAELDWSQYQRPEGVPRLFVREIGGGGTERTQVMCGFLGCDLRPFNPLFAGLPRMIHLSSREGPDPGWLDRFIDAVLEESAHKRAGGENVLARLAELMFVEVVRRYLDTMPADHGGWLAGLRDRAIGRALAAMHARPAYPWSLEELAKEAGLSRSALAERFAQLVGMPPMQYLAQWRIQLAASLISNGTLSINAVAERVGYESEAAFNRAFKRLVGIAPGAWRKARMLPSGAPLQAAETRETVI
jgi:AraC-like DNA-binding protein